MSHHGEIESFVLCHIMVMVFHKNAQLQSDATFSVHFGKVVRNGIAVVKVWITGSL